MSTLRILPIADTHCGHVSGLTAPDWWTNEKRHPGGWGAFQRAAWQCYLDTVTARRWDVCLLVGDVIDGRQEKEGGLELIAATPEHQVALACECLSYVRADRWAGVRGTPYHCGQCTQYEDAIFDAVGAKLRGNTLTVDIDGLVVDLRHDISSAATALRNEVATSRAWAVEHGTPLASLYLRGHVHEMRRETSGSGRHAWTACTLPSLQGQTRYGQLRVHRRVVHFGISWLEYDTKTRRMTWHDEIHPLCELSASSTPAKL